jgi:hypothetical protein
MDKIKIVLVSSIISLIVFSLAAIISNRMDVVLNNKILIHKEKIDLMIEHSYRKGYIDGWGKANPDSGIIIEKNNLKGFYNK